MIIGHFSKFVFFLNRFITQNRAWLGDGGLEFGATDLQLQELPVPSQPINPRPTHRLREAKHTKYIFGAHIMIIKMSLNENSASVKG